MARCRKRCRRLGCLAAGVGMVLWAGCGGQGPEFGTSPPVASQGPRAWHYTVVVDEALRSLEVTACFDGTPPRWLVAGNRRAASAVVQATRNLRRLEGPDRVLSALARTGRAFDLRPLTADECVVYVVDVDRVLAASWSSGFRSRDAVVLDAAAWLWRPEPYSRAVSGTVRFVMPDGQRVGVSWERLDRDTFRLPASAFGFLSHVVLGTFAERQVVVPGTALRVVRLPGELALSDDELDAWLAHAGVLVSQLSGRFPVPRPLVVLVPVRGGSDPVAFGNVGRGGGPSVMLLVRRNATVAALRSDWVTTHEFSHLAFPFVRRSERFLSEGLATYFQEVLRARGGVHSELAGWQLLDGGFRAGRRAGTGRTLREESRDVFETYAFRRIYWVGAALAFLCDIELRKLGSSLEAALAALPEDARQRAEAWSARRLAETLDRTTGHRVFQPVLGLHLESAEFPSLGPTYDFLGLVRDEEDRVVGLDDQAPGAAIRQSIMAGGEASRLALE